MNISLSEQLDPLEARNTQKKFKKNTKKQQALFNKVC